MTDSSYVREGCQEAVIESSIHLCTKLNRIISLLLQSWGMLAKSAHKKFWEAVLAGVKNEMAVPRMAESARHTISQQKWGANQPMRSNIEALPKISFDLDGVVALNESFAPGGTIFSQGDIAKTLMYVQAGRVKLSVASKNNREAIVAILGPGEFLGEMCIGSRNTRMGTATAIVPTALRVIEKKEMVRALHADHALSYAFLSYLLSRNIRLEEDLTDQVSHSSERRLARILLLLAGKGNQREPHGFAGISQGTLAAMIGVTRGRVNFFMNKFRKRGFIKYRSHLYANGGIQINASRLAKVLR
jgi:CRP/FNR family transcriptional regulator, cyclic AMP receptor protein